MLAEIDALLKQEIKGNGPGAAVAVVQGGAVVHAGGYGLANLEWNIPVDTDTVFRLASVTKQFTAAAVLLLQERGVLHVHDPITKFLPDYPTSGHHITVHHLLTHTSGIFSYTNDPDFLNKCWREVTPQQLADEFSRVPFDFKPGTRYQYNNSGYILLGMIIEKVSGKSYAEFLQENIFDPLDMKRTYYLHNESIIPKRASGYDETPDGFVNARFLHMTQPYAAGALGSTVNDLVLWDRALAQNDLLSAESQAQMYTPAVLEDGSATTYGYGWGINLYRDHPLVHHGGGIFGFRTFIARFRQDNLTVIVLSNSGACDVEKITTAIARHMLNLPEIKHKPYGLGEEGLKKCAGKYRVGAFPLEVTLKDGRLVLLLGKEIPLIPTSRTQFYDVNNPEFTVMFSDEQDGLYTRLEMVGPFFKETAVRIVENA